MLSATLWYTRKAALTRHPLAVLELLRRQHVTARRSGALDAEQVVIPDRQCALTPAGFIDGLGDRHRRGDAVPALRRHGARRDLADEGLLTGWCPGRAPRKPAGCSWCRTAWRPRTKRRRRHPPSPAAPGWPPCPPAVLCPARVPVPALDAVPARPALPGPRRGTSPRRGTVRAAEPARAGRSRLRLVAAPGRAIPAGCGAGCPRTGRRAVARRHARPRHHAWHGHHALHARASRSARCAHHPGRTFLSRRAARVPCPIRSPCPALLSGQHWPSGWLLDVSVAVWVPGTAASPALAVTASGWPGSWIPAVSAGGSRSAGRGRAPCRRAADPPGRRCSPPDSRR